MPGFEFFGDEERKELNDVLETGILMRYGFDGARKGHWKAKELEVDRKNFWLQLCTTYQQRYVCVNNSNGSTWYWLW